MAEHDVVRARREQIGEVFHAAGVEAHPRPDRLVLGLQRLAERLEHARIRVDAVDLVAELGQPQRLGALPAPGVEHAQRRRSVG